MQERWFTSGIWKVERHGDGAQGIDAADMGDEGSGEMQTPEFDEESGGMCEIQ
jgi:hypothetical protein